MSGPTPPPPSLPTGPLPPGTPLPPELRSPVMLQHLSPLLIYLVPGVGNVLGALLAWLATRDRHPLLDAQGKEVLNFQVSLWLYSLLLGALTVLLFGAGLIGALFTLGGSLIATLVSMFALVWPATLLLYLLQLVSMVLAIVATNRGTAYRYPLNWRLLR